MELEAEEDSLSELEIDQELERDVESLREVLKAANSGEEVGNLKSANYPTHFETHCGFSAAGLWRMALSLRVLVTFALVYCCRRPI